MIEIKKFVFNDWQENTYLIYDETKEAVLIDCGIYYANEQEVFKDFVIENDIKIKYLLNTHLHIDHVMGNEFILNEFGLSAMAHQDDIPVLEQAPKYSEILGLETIVNPPQITNFIYDNDIIEFGNSRLSVLHVPGHCPGHVAFYNHEQKFAVVGDILFLNSIGRTDLPLGNYDQLIKAIKTKLLSLDDEVVIHPGHGPKTSIGNERQNNPYLKYD